VADDGVCDDLHNRGSVAVKVALTRGCPVCEAEPGNDCHNLANDFPLPRQRLVHFCRASDSNRGRIS
jgi:hypothetical protein